jgi:hypothetical protein
MIEVGTIVHYWPRVLEGEEGPLAAIVTKVHEPGVVNLMIISSSGRHTNAADRAKEWRFDFSKPHVEDKRGKWSRI